MKTNYIVTLEFTQGHPGNSRIATLIVFADDAPDAVSKAIEKFHAMIVGEVTIEFAFPAPFYLDNGVTAFTL